MIFSFVWAVLAELGLLCVIVWYMGSTALGINRELLYTLTESKTLTDMASILLTDAITALLGGILLAFAYRYLKSEQQYGTPFTRHGAEKIKRAGIKAIIFSLVAIAVSETVFVVCELPAYAIEGRGNFYAIALGIILIFCLLIFRHGAGSEKNSGNINSDKNDII